MGNTSRLIVYTLQQLNADGDPTGITKPNVPGDPDYILPVIDPISCPLPVGTTSDCPLPLLSIYDGDNMGFEFSIAPSLHAAWLLNEFKSVRLYVCEGTGGPDSNTVWYQEEWALHRPNYFQTVIPATEGHTYYFTIVFVHANEDIYKECLDLDTFMFTRTLDWEPASPYCEKIATCEAGFTPVGQRCIQETTAVPTGPAWDDHPVAGNTTNLKWNNGGARIFAPGFTLAGTGTVSNYLLTPLWLNGTSQWHLPSRSISQGRMNNTALALDRTPGDWLGFSSLCSIVGAAKRVYIGIASEFGFRIAVNGTLIVDCPGPIDGAPNWNFFNLYPVDLPIGEHFIEVWGQVGATESALAAEIYRDVTPADLTAATTVSGFCTFSTGDMAGQPFQLGSVAGFACPAGYFLDNLDGDPDAWICRQVVEGAASLVNTGMSGYTTRRRLVDGIWDGFEEPNLDGTGQGPFFPLVSNPTLCP